MTSVIGASLQSQWDTNKNISHTLEVKEEPQQDISVCTRTKRLRNGDKEKDTDIIVTDVSIYQINSKMDNIITYMPRHKLFKRPFLKG